MLVPGLTGGAPSTRRLGMEDSSLAEGACTAEHEHGQERLRWPLRSGALPLHAARAFVAPLVFLSAAHVIPFSSFLVSHLSLIVSYLISLHLRPCLLAHLLGGLGCERGARRPEDSLIHPHARDSCCALSHAEELL
ncbi:hypothetical protein DFH08DRAFT_972918 [Mycena albidolilacea]|uniref:Uncharacterized protein n=1 Tax=Mycena albidolilacea TaxID=1033008 RepID=A0AAD7ECX8_9AGAR|nr:hypothetical protein DFH08DRAFT_972918 [Mycena albidolilacea]